MAGWHLSLFQSKICDAPVARVSALFWLEYHLIRQSEVDRNVFQEYVCKNVHFLPSKRFGGEFVIAF
jgi:hypothetical protein